MEVQAQPHMEELQAYSRSHPGLPLGSVSARILLVIASPLARHVLALPYEEREALLAALLESLNGDLDTDDAGPEEWQEAWSVELEARVRDLDAGLAKTFPAEQVLAEMRAGVVPTKR
jgi:putative addiction module component (TIGR02574 family)